MSRSSEVVEIILSDMLRNVTETVQTESISSLDLSFSKSPEHPLPCSADFEFFFTISKAAPPHSPGDGSSSLQSNITSISFSSLPSSLCHPASPPSRGSQPPSPGVALLPLSGQMLTQAFPRARAALSRPTFAIQLQDNDDTLEIIGLGEDTPESKRIKRELVEDIDVEEMYNEHTEELDDDNLDQVDYTYEDCDSEKVLALPLTFNNSADLRWKLQKAAILPQSNDLTNQRPSTVTRAEKLLNVDNNVSIIKEEINDLEVDVDKNEVDNNIDDSELLTYKEDNNEKVLVSSIPSTVVKLLNKPPRLGLSKLYKKFNNLHEVSIIEKEE